MTEKEKSRSAGVSGFFAQIPARVFWSALIAILVVCGIISFARSGAPTDAERAKSIAQQLRCLECEGLSIDDSDTKTSKTIIKDVERRVAAGESDEKIFAYYENIYGEFILLAPTAERGNWLIYVIPAFFIIVLVAAIFLSVRRKVSSRTQIIFWAVAGVLFVVGIGLFVNDSKSTEKKATAAQEKTSEQLLQQAVNESPNNGNYRSLAIVQFAKEDFVNALQNFDKAAALNPSDAESRGYAAYIIFLSGQYELAATRAQKAVEADSSDVTALFFRGVIYLQTPQTDAALKQANEDLANKDFDSVLSLAPQSDLAAQIKELRAGN